MRFSCCLCCWLYVQLLCAQNLSGCWVGTLWQGTGPDAEAFQFEICLQEQGSHYQGQSLIQCGELFARYELRGQQERKMLFLRELNVLNERREVKMDWCTKVLQLEWHQTAQGEVLLGSWRGSSEVYGTCQPGRVKLVRRRNNRA